MSDIIADIDAILRGDISGPVRVRGVLRDAKAEIERLQAIVMGRQVAVKNSQILTEWTNRQIDKVLTLPVVRIERHDVPTTEDPTHG